jgi:AcrR family transcriptional regulator
MNAESEISPSPAVREPLQGRSRASFERMLAAAQQLMTERGSDDFTLTDVSKTGKVSIGSIYCRFDSKDALIHAVQQRESEKIEADQDQAVQDAVTRATDLDSLVALLVDNIAETLRDHAAILRPLMYRASTDPIVANRGKQGYTKLSEAVHGALIARRSEIRHGDPDRAIQSCFRILYASIARYLGFGTAAGSASEGDWQILKEDLGFMCAAFLKSPCARRTAA